MKKIVALILLTIITLSILCSCNVDWDKVVEAMNEYAEIVNETTSKEIKSSSPEITTEETHTIAIPDDIIVADDESVVECDDGVILIYPKNEIELNYRNYLPNGSIITTYKVQISDAHYTHNILQQFFAFTISFNKTFDAEGNEAGSDCRLTIKLIDETEKRIASRQYSTSGLLVGGHCKESPAFPGSFTEGHIYRIVISDGYLYS